MSATELPDTIKFCCKCNKDFATNSDRKWHLLPCFHTICDTCVRETYINVVRRKCPFKIREGLFCDQPYNREQVIPHYLLESNLWCDADECTQKYVLAVARCNQCTANQNLCQECVDAHKRVTQTLGHTLRPLRKPTDCTELLIQTGKCVHHNGQTVTCRCRQCKTDLCDLCTAHLRNHALEIDRSNFQQDRQKYCREYDAKMKGMKDFEDKLRIAIGDKERTVQLLEGGINRVITQRRIDVLKIPEGDVIAKDELQGNMDNLQQTLQRKADLFARFVSQTMKAATIVKQVRLFCEAFTKQRRGHEVAFYLKPAMEQQRQVLQSCACNLPNSTITLEWDGPSLSPEMRDILENIGATITVEASNLAEGALLAHIGPAPPSPDEGSESSPAATGRASVLLPDSPIDQSAALVAQAPIRVPHALQNGNHGQPAHVVRVDQPQAQPQAHQRHPSVPQMSPHESSTPAVIRPPQRRVQPSCGQDRERMRLETQRRREQEQQQAMQSAQQQHVPPAHQPQQDQALLVQQQQQMQYRMQPAQQQQRIEPVPRNQQANVAAQMAPQIQQHPMQRMAAPEPLQQAPTQANFLMQQLQQQQRFAAQDQQQAAMHQQRSQHLAASRDQQAAMLASATPQQHNSMQQMPTGQYPMQYNVQHQQVPPYGRGSPMQQGQEMAQAQQQRYAQYVPSNMQQHTNQHAQMQYFPQQPNATGNFNANAQAYVLMTAADGRPFVQYVTNPIYTHVPGTIRHSHSPLPSNVRSRPATPTAAAPAVAAPTFTGHIPPHASSPMFSGMLNPITNPGPIPPAPAPSPYNTAIPPHNRAHPSCAQGQGQGSPTPYAPSAKPARKRSAPASVTDQTAYERQNTVAYGIDKQSPVSHIAQSPTAHALVHQHIERSINEVLAAVSPTPTGLNSEQLHQGGYAVSDVSSSGESVIKAVDTANDSSEAESTAHIKQLVHSPSPKQETQPTESESKVEQQSANIVQKVAEGADEAKSADLGINQKKNSPEFIIIADSPPGQETKVDTDPNSKETEAEWVALKEGVCCVCELEKADAQVCYCNCGCELAFHLETCHLPYVSAAVYNSDWEDCTVCIDIPDYSNESDAQSISKLEKFKCQRLLLRMLCSRHSSRLYKSIKYMMKETTRDALRNLFEEFSLSDFTVHKFCFTISTVIEPENERFKGFFREELKRLGLEAYMVKE